MVILPIEYGGVNGSFSRAMSYFAMEYAFIEDGDCRKRGKTHVKRHISNILHEYEGFPIALSLPHPPHLVYDDKDRPDLLNNTLPEPLESD